MKKIRKGNDIGIEWTLLAEDGTPYIPRDTARIFLCCGMNSVSITDFTVDENVISFTFYGKDQKYVGCYGLLIIENDGERDMVTFDTQGAFQLVYHSWQTGGDDCCGHIKTEFVTITSNMMMTMGPPGPPGKSAYEIAVEHGFIGTEEEWLASLGGGGCLTSDLNVTKEVGGISSGDSYPAGTKIEDILNDMLSPTMFPTLTPPSVSIVYGAPSLVKVGYVIPAQNADVWMNRGSINPQYSAESPYRSGIATDFKLDFGGDRPSPLYDQDPNHAIFRVHELTRSAKGDIVLRATAQYAAGVQPKDSAGNDYSDPLPAGSVSASQTISFVLPFRYGPSASKTVTDLDALDLRESVTRKENKVCVYDTDNQYMVFAYDKDYGQLKSILDQNSFETISGWTRTTLGDYAVYVSDLPTTDTGASYTFKF